MFSEGKWKGSSSVVTENARRRILAENYRERLQAYMTELKLHPENHQDVLKNAGRLIAELDLR